MIHLFFGTREIHTGHQKYEEAEKYNKIKANSN